MFEVYEEYKGYTLFELLTHGSVTGQWIIKTVIREEERILAKGTTDEVCELLALAVLESAIIRAVLNVASNLIDEDIQILIDLEMEGKLK